MTNLSHTVDTTSRSILLKQIIIWQSLKPSIEAVNGKSLVRYSLVLESTIEFSCTRSKTMTVRKINPSILSLRSILLKTKD